MSQKEIANKCFGCEYYGGNRGCIAICDNNNTGVYITRGCSDYTPDISASCDGCFYSDKTISIRDITCKKYGYIGERRQYCEGHAERVENCE